MFQMKGIGNQAPGDGGGGDVPRGFKEQEGDLCGGWGKMSERRNVGNEEWVRQSRILRATARALASSMGKTEILWRL